MIFVTIGTHPGQFDRLLRRIDEIAPKIKEKIIIQRGFTKYIPKNTESFTFADDLDPYFNEARLVIVHGATSLTEFVLKYKKPIITVPRQKRYGEHINDHQVEFAEALTKNTGILSIINISDLTPELLKNYKKVPKINKENLSTLRNNFIKIFNDYQDRKNHIIPKPYATNRIDYVVNLLEPKKTDRVLNIGVSNIPEIEIAIEDKVKECTTIDIDKSKMEKAKKFLKKTKFIIDDVTKSKIKSNYYDKIVMLEVLEHLDKDEQVLQELSRILKKGGTIIIGVPNMHPLHLINPVLYFEHKRHYSNSKLTRRLEKAGFKVQHLNVVETWTLLANLYLHLFYKFVLRKNIPFITFKKKASQSYMQQNKRGMDIITKAIKVA